MKSILYGGKWRRLSVFLPLIFVVFLGSACGRKLEKAYSFKQAEQRMNAQSGSGEGVRAKPFANSLAVMGNTDFNAEELSSPAFLLADYSTKEKPEPLAYRNPYARTYQASITKVMTALVCLETVQDLNQEFTVTQRSMIRDEGSSSALLKVGDRLRIEDLLYGMLLPSGNDAAVAVAEASAGSVEAFVKKMNETALRLGLTGTHFVNPNGLPSDDHYTTAYDIYLLLAEAMKYEEFRKIVGSTSYTVNYRDKNNVPKTQIWKGSNQFMTGERETPEDLKVLGGKTGTTKKAGYCLTMDTERISTQKEYISVVMKDDSKDELYSDMTKLLKRIPA